MYITFTRNERRIRGDDTIRASGSLLWSYGSEDSKRIIDDSDDDLNCFHLF